MQPQPTTIFSKTFGLGNTPPAPARRAGFSLIEILVVVALLSVIILGLVAMFSQVQRAFLSGTTQIDLLESGRVSADFVARDLQQMAAGYTTAPNFYTFPETGDSSLNLRPWFAQGPPPAYKRFPPPVKPPVFPPLTQWMPDHLEQRTNVLQSFYFLTQYNRQWNLVGYFVDRPDLGVGTLYRTNMQLTNFAGVPGLAPTNGFILADVANILAGAGSTTPTNYSRIADGVVHLRLRAYDANGLAITNFALSSFSTKYSDIFVAGMDDLTRDDYYSFFSNALPAYLELEMGFLENRTLDRYNSLSNNPAAAAAYLVNHLGQVHVFRQRIPIRNVDPSAYQ
jgi:prepilin-type N-terminal cleavage/methylation domain-containing protein